MLPTAGATAGATPALTLRSSTPRPRTAILPPWSRLLYVSTLLPSLHERASFDSISSSSHEDTVRIQRSWCMGFHRGVLRRGDAHSLRGEASSRASGGVGRRGPLEPAPRHHLRRSSDFPRGLNHRSGQIADDGPLLTHLKVGFVAHLASRGRGPQEKGGTAKRAAKRGSGWP